MQYLSVADARQRSGLRLVLTTGVPGPWSEAAKAVFKVRGVDYLPVAQEAMAPNEELLAWTGHRNAPIACLNDEPPLVAWLDIVLLAEQLGTGPSLLPADELNRALCLGLITEMAGRDGIGWNRRHQVMGAYLNGPDGYAVPAGMEPVVRAYQVTPAAIAAAPNRLATILDGLTRQLRCQQAAGSDYLIGDTLTAADIYWACFSMMFRPLPAEVNPMPDWLRPLYSACDDTVEAALDPLLFAHRDRIYTRHIGLPLEY
jgi:glutathione S-transferase